MKPTIIRDIPRPDPAVSHAMAEHGVATVHEAYQRRGLLDPRLRPISDGWSVAGPAVTSLNHPGDNLMIHAALSVAEPGDMLVIATTVPCICGMVGELLARQGKQIGLAGIVIDAGVRDVADLRRLGLPIWTAAISAAGSVKATPGWVNVPLVCGSQVISPGDIIVADDDGVVAIASDQTAAVLEASAARTAREAAIRTRIEGGELSFDMNNLSGYLAERGVAAEGTSAGGPTTDVSRSMTEKGA